MLCIRRFPLATLFVASILATAGPRPALAETSVTDIGTINGRASVGTSINHPGHVAGISEFSGTIGTANGPPAEPFLTHAVLWSGGAIHDLGALGGVTTCSPVGCQSAAFGINDQDWVVGWTDNGINGTLPVVWLPSAVPGGGAGINVLPALTPSAGSAAVAVNNRGQMVGFSKLANFTTRAALWQLGPAGPTLTDLGTIRADKTGSAVADGINDLGQIVGAATDEHLLPQAFLYLPAPSYGLPAGMNDLTGALGATAEALDVNEHGEVVGLVAGSTPFVWLPAPAHGLPAGLSLLTLGRSLLAFLPGAISDGGVIVGQAYVETNPATHAFVIKPAAWRNGGFIYLNDLLPKSTPWELSSAADVIHVGKTTRITGLGLLPDVADVNGLTPSLHGYVLEVTCPADLNDDGEVDKSDLAILRSQIGQSVPPGTGGDLDGDGDVDQQDQTLLTAQFGEACLSGGSTGSASVVAQSAGTPPSGLSRFTQPANGSALPVTSIFEKYDPEFVRRPFDVAMAQAGTTISNSSARGAASSANGRSLIADRTLSAWPLPYRGGSLHVSLSRGASVGANAQVAIYDVSGRRVRTLSGAASGGSESLQWDGRDAKGAAVGNGIYFVRAIGAGRTAQLKIVVIR